MLRGACCKVRVMKRKVPPVISEQQRQGGLARARLYTSAQLRQQAFKAWRTRRARALNQTISPGMKRGE
jgi:hypothetical protein